ncbi:competence protein ComEA [Acetitomaculum ruminis DSM 5522]|uniref:Competence protein ComEA n=1 Tax=Acetitomaculum ruminis DSM 5522 TaxID=1120918 RepID=A0A1I1AIB7_9FIRM|nr:helix-hairpin-helix domain-containing protein [Acetitomaculum ruminis]SFB37232.1 competence protein ComEA [Acetitomaculum ruminis DSM 5522]
MKNYKKNFILLIIMMLSLSACGLKEESVSDFILEDSNDISTSETSENSEVSEDIYVYVCGQVNNPGVFKLKKDDRIFKAIEMAGGTTENADISGINQAQKLEDGQMINIPSFGDESIEEVSKENADDGKVNINTADEQTLTLLSGIGEKRARDIIDYRNSNGNFSSVEDLKKVKGIKNGVYNKIKDFVKVN